VNPFDSFYAKFYNHIHKEKDYDSEVSKLVNFGKTNNILFKNTRILDFGCGTGKHANSLANIGYSVDGYDPSPYMISEAINSFNKSNFYSDIGVIKDNYDLVYSLFDVLSYQSTDLQVTNFLTQISSKLKNNGSVILDYWNLEGVAKSPPINKIKKFDYMGKNFFRIVKVMKISPPHLTKLHIEIHEENSQQILYQDDHIMRAFSLEEIELLLPPDMKLKMVLDQSDYRSLPNSDSWRALALIRKI
jgi:SAM-dependent methyltransferase